MTSDQPPNLDHTEDLVRAIAAGEMVVLLDDEDRENEGDLVMSASFVDAKAINFMARYGRGLICMPITRQRAERLGLKLMVGDNREVHSTKFTVSVDAARGITTGISAQDRAAAVQAATASDAKPSDLVQPGHIFPLVSEDGGVLVRAGHTEAACDLCRLAGLEPAATIVEILNEDGTMARRPELETFAAEHNLRIGTIADLIHYRLVNEQTIERIGECRLPTRFAQFRMVGYRDITNRRVHLALVLGEVVGDQPMLIRVHVQDSLTDLTGSLREESTWTLGAALKRIADEGQGVLVVLREDESDDMLTARLHAYAEEDDGVEHPARDHSSDLRTYGLGAQILLNLGVRRMRVMSSPKRMLGISGFGLEVTEYVS